MDYKFLKNLTVCIRQCKDAGLRNLDQYPVWVIFYNVKIIK